MISPLKQVWFCLFGPRLYKIHRDGPQSKLYFANSCERWGEQVLQSLNIIWNITVYTSPFLAIYLYKKDYFDVKTLPTTFKYLSGVSVVVAASYCLRAYGRATNPQYKDFMKLLSDALRNSSSVDASVLRRFDFDFSAWPVNYDTRTVDTSPGINYVLTAYKSVRNWKDIPLNIISEIVKPFALKLTYPGSMSLVQMTVWHVLLEGRIKLVETYNGLRYKLKTRDNNDIDCMFVDRRNSSVNGKTLVITCEGNAGFYEIGVMSTPIEGEYSVLGWNHPGFGGSTGTPYPTQEHYAMDAVMQFAIHKLGFTPENIILYGWSIGGYSVAWAASQYPDIKGVFLDATFDDILPLAVIRMPSSWASLVTKIIRAHLNLNIAEILKEYNGPIKIVRRTMDEIITTEDGKLSSNRGNDLLIKLLSHRYPDLFEGEQFDLARQFLSLQGAALQVFMNKNHPGDADKNKKVISLLQQHLLDYQSTHCTPLPTNFFIIPKPVSL